VNRDFGGSRMIRNVKANECFSLSPLQPVGIPTILALDSCARVDFPLLNTLRSPTGQLFLPET
jgi:hypothetical protein